MKIFKNQTSRKNLFFTLGGFIGEVIIIFSLSAITALFVTIAPFFRSNYLFRVFPDLETNLIQFLIKIGPHILLFLATFFTYRFAPGTKPSIKLCLSTAFCSSGIYFVIQKFLKLFLNMSRYNLVYGVLSNLIVLLLEVFIFFQI